MRLWLTLLPAALLSACEGARRADPPAASAGVPATSSAVASSPAPPVALDSGLALLVAPIDTLSTLGAWIAAHPTDRVGQTEPEGTRGSPICRTTVTSLTIVGRRATRSAIFNVPNPPDGEVLRADTTQLAEQTCHLRAVWVEVAEPDSVRAEALADSLSRMLDGALGAGRYGLAISGAGTGRWLSGRTWTGRGTTVGMGIVPFVRAYEGEGVSHPATPSTVVLAAIAPHSSYDPISRDSELTGFDDEETSDRELELARADSTIEWAGLPRIATDLRAGVAHLRNLREGEPVRTPALDTIVLRAMAATRDTAPHLQPARRAAALLAADIVVNGFVGTLDDGPPESESYRSRTAYERAGATFEAEGIDRIQGYLRPWLWEAYRLDPRGPAGHAAFVTLLEHGWTTKPGCGDGSDEFTRVIEQGEVALAHGASDPLVHYYVGLAYADIVSLSQHERDEFVDPTAYASRAPAARQKAIEHLRAALPGLSDRRMRRHAWRIATLLMLGRSGDTRWFCVND